MQIKFAFALGLFVSLSFVWAGVDPFGGVLRFAGGARPCPLLIFGKFYDFTMTPTAVLLTVLGYIAMLFVVAGIAGRRVSNTGFFYR